MKKLSEYFSLSVVAFLVCAPVAAQEQHPPGQEEAAPSRETALTLTLNKVIGQPGKEASLPVLFGRRQGAPNMAKLRVRMSYPGSVLKFNRAEDAYLSRRAKLQIQAKEEKGAGAESVLELNFELPDPQANFPSGQIATVLFDIAAGAPDQVVPLKPQAWIDGAEILPDSPTAQIEPGEVRVSENPVFMGCFFFSH